jgi:hypothetical protein
MSWHRDSRMARSCRSAIRAVGALRRIRGRRLNLPRPENPDGTLHFEYATQTQDGSSTTSGDVTLDADGRVAKVALTTTWQSTAKGRLDTGTVGATLELFDYGVDVKVKRPTDVVPAN